MTAHETQFRVYYEDTDAGGVVYHARYLGFAERGRTEMLRAAGFEHAALLKDGGIAFAVVAMDIQYKAPARLDDLIAVRSRITRIGGASMDMAQDICRGEQTLTQLKLTLVCVDGNFKPVKLPDEIRKMGEK